MTCLNFSLIESAFPCFIHVQDLAKTRRQFESRLCTAHSRSGHARGHVEGGGERGEGEGGWGRVGP